MNCKITQNTIDALLRLKHNSATTINRMGSYEDRTSQCVRTINELMDKYETQNKIASSQSTTAATTTATKGEIAELQSLLKAYIH
jgi:hypothetical protein